MSLHWACSGCVGDLVHIWAGLPHVGHHGASEFHGGSRGGLHDCWRLPQRRGATLPESNNPHEACLW